MPRVSPPTSPEKNDEAQPKRASKVKFADTTDEKTVVANEDDDDDDTTPRQSSDASSRFFSAEERQRACHVHDYPSAMLIVRYHTGLPEATMAIRKKADTVSATVSK